MVNKLRIELNWGVEGVKGDVGKGVGGDVGKYGGVCVRKGEGRCGGSHLE